MTNAESFNLDFRTCVDRELQLALERIDRDLRNKYGMLDSQTAVGLLDLKKLRLAMINPDREEYAASVPKIGILLAWFVAHPKAATNIDATTKHELGLMIKASSNEMAAKFSETLGLKEIQQTINDFGFYDPAHGGGIWVGKHYGQSSERYGDPIHNHSHAATVRQLLRFYLALEQGKLISPRASAAMREIFQSPEIPHDEIKFVKALKNEDVEIIRKWGSWQDWFHDTGVVTGPNTHYIIVALTHHPRGDAYLEDLARALHNLLRSN